MRGNSAEKCRLQAALAFAKRPRRFKITAMTFREKLETRIASAGSRLCVGLDVRADQADEATKRWILDFIAETAPHAAAFKPNSAYFEALGWRGLRLLEEVLREIPSDIPIVLDVKRGDIGETQGTPVNFPMIGDPERKVADLYDMIHPNANDTLTVRSVFVIGPDKKVKLTITYPASTGRNFDEILRVIDSLQLTANYKVATPANWTDGNDVIIGAAVTDDEAKQLFPQGWTTVKPYLRVLPQPNK